MTRKDLLAMVNVVCLLVYVVMCLLLCQKQANESRKQNDEISITFCPTGIEDDARYSINVRNDSLIALSHPNQPTEKAEYKLKLFSGQMAQISALTENITTKHISSKQYEDTWEMTLRINNQVYYKEMNYYWQEEPKEVKDLLNYLMSLTEMEIDLYGFA